MTSYSYTESFIPTTLAMPKSVIARHAEKIQKLNEDDISALDIKKAGLHEIKALAAKLIGLLNEKQVNDFDSAKRMVLDETQKFALSIRESALKNKDPQLGKPLKAESIYSFSNDTSTLVGTPWSSSETLVPAGPSPSMEVSTPNHSTTPVKEIEPPANPESELTFNQLAQRAESVLKDLEKKAEAEKAPQKELTPPPQSDTPQANTNLPPPSAHLSPPDSKTPRRARQRMPMPSRLSTIVETPETPQTQSTPAVSTAPAKNMMAPKSMEEYRRELYTLFDSGPPKNEPVTKNNASDQVKKTPSPKPLARNKTALNKQPQKLEILVSTQITVTEETKSQSASGNTSIAQENSTSTSITTAKPGEFVLRHTSRGGIEHNRVPEPQQGFVDRLRKKFASKVDLLINRYVRANLDLGSKTMAEDPQPKALKSEKRKPSPIEQVPLPEWSHGDRSIYLVLSDAIRNDTTIKDLKKYGNFIGVYHEHKAGEGKGKDFCGKPILRGPDGAVYFKIDSARQREPDVIKVPKDLIPEGQEIFKGQIYKVKSDGKQATMELQKNAQKSQKSALGFGRK